MIQHQLMTTKAKLAVAQNLEGKSTDLTAPRFVAQGVRSLGFEACMVPARLIVGDLQLVR